MRSLICLDSPKKIELLDGVKYLLKDGWCLVLPDADLPLFSIYSEGITKKVSEDNASIYLNIIQTIVSDD